MGFLGSFEDEQKLQALRSLNLQISSTVVQIEGGRGWSMKGKKKKSEKRERYRKKLSELQEGRKS